MAPWAGRAVFNGVARCACPARSSRAVVGRPGEARAGKREGSIGCHLAGTCRASISLQLMSGSTCTGGQLNDACARRRNRDEEYYRLPNETHRKEENDQKKKEENDQ